MTRAPGNPAPRCGLILHDDPAGAEALLAAFVETLARRPVRLGGVLQDTNRDDPDHPCRMTMVDVATGQRFALSQDLGRASDSCRLDTDALARGAVILRQAIAARVDLVIVNKFGKQEAEGQGLVAELFEALSEGLPVLVPIHRRHWVAWETLSGGVGDIIVPTPAALWDWVRGLHLPGLEHPEPTGA